MKFLRINDKNISYLNKFIKNMGNSSKGFRYYSKRNPHMAIGNHILTFLLMDDDAVGYGHLDKEEEKVWLGICVKEGCQGKGYGREIMKRLTGYHTGDIYLSVDKDNEAAVNLYKLFSFEKIGEEANIFYMKRGQYDTCV